MFNNHDSQLLKGIEHKTKCRCFFDEPEAVRSRLAGLTKRFGYFGAPKYHAPAAESGKNNICDHKLAHNGFINESAYKSHQRPECPIYLGRVSVNVFRKAMSFVFSDLLNPNGSVPSVWLSGPIFQPAPPPSL